MGDRDTAEAVTRVENVTAFIGEEFEPSIVDIALRDGVIEAVEPAGSGSEVPAGGGTVLDGTGLMAFPGMVDCHDHLRNITPACLWPRGSRWTSS